MSRNRDAALFGWRALDVMYEYMVRNFDGRICGRLCTAEEWACRVLLGSRDGCEGCNWFEWDDGSGYGEGES